MTEEQAKTKWCPMFRAGYMLDGGLPTNRLGGKCIASDCMLWKWKACNDYRRNDLYYDQTVERCVNCRKYKKLHFQGYCGLTSKA